ncbi:MAG: hypothetical protein KC635_26225, partial [Myxococcales bacterium]|nr:hypothetical protein [Myxococcales bacterium]
LAASACAPETVIRRSAAIPGASLPARVGGETHRGEVRISGHVNAVRGDQVELEALFPEEGDPGVFIPDFELGGSLYFGLPRGFEIGAQVLYASGEWQTPNTVGVLRFPRGLNQDVLLGGVGFRWNLPLRHPELRLSILTELNFSNIREAVFVRDGDTGEYGFDHAEEELFFLPNAAIQAGWEISPDGTWSLTPYLVIGGQRSVTNVGFDNNLASLDDSTLEGFGVFYFGLGAEMRYDMFAFGASFYYPVDSVELIDFGPSLAFTMSGIFGGWDGDRAPEPRRYRAPRDRRDDPRYDDPRYDDPRYEDPGYDDPGYDDPGYRL